MRNLKKVLSLALALVMLLGMMVVGAGAATSFKDDADIKNQEAVAVLVGMGIMKGRVDDATKEVLFDPTGTLTRAEAAKMIAQLDLGVVAADALKGNGTSPFSDVWSGYWAEGAIDYCVEQGYITGDGAGHFFPSRNVSSVEFGIMLLRLLGYDAKIEGLVGDQWATKGAALARKAGLTVAVAANTEPMTRDAMAQMAFNALTASMVEYEGMDITIGDVAINARVKVRTHSQDQGGLYSNKTYNGKTPTPTTPIRLCEERFPDLKLATGSRDGFKREYSVWTWKNVDIAGSKVLVKADAEFTAETTASAVSSAINGATGARADTPVYVNGKQVTTIAGTDVNADLIASWTENGRQVLVYLKEDDHKAIEKVVVVDTFVAQVNSVGSDSITLNLLGDTQPATTAVSDLKNDSKADVYSNRLSLLSGSLASRTVKTTGFAAGDLVTYTAAYGSNGKYSIVADDVAMLSDPVTGTLTAWKGSNLVNDNKVGNSNSSFTVDSGDPYKYSINNVVVDSDGGSISIYDFAVNKSEINVYVDKYGYAIYVSGVEVAKNYAAVIGMGSNQYGSETRGVTLLLPDNTTVEVTAKMSAADWAAMTVQPADDPDAGKNLVTDGLADVVTYTVDDKGVYTLSRVALPRVSNPTAAQYTGMYKVPTVKPVFANGKSEMKIEGTSYYTTNRTIFMVGSCNTSDNTYSYSVYTGYANAPSIADETTVHGIAFGLNRTLTRQIDVVYIDASNLSNATGNEIYFAFNKNVAIDTTSNGSFVTVPAVVDGKVEDIMISATISKDWDGTGTKQLRNVTNNGLYVIDTVVRNDAGIITNCTVKAKGAGNDILKAFPAGKQGVVKAGYGVIGFGQANEGDNIFWAYTENSKGYYIDKDYTSITETAIGSFYTDKNDYVWANGDSVNKKVDTLFVVEVEGNEAPSNTYTVRYTVDGGDVQTATVTNGNDWTYTAPGNKLIDTASKGVIADDEKSVTVSEADAKTDTIAITLKDVSTDAPVIDKGLTINVIAADKTAGVKITEAHVITTGDNTSSGKYNGYAVGDLYIAYELPAGAVGIAAASGTKMSLNATQNGLEKSVASEDITAAGAPIRVTKAAMDTATFAPTGEINLAATLIASRTYPVSLAKESGVDSALKFTAGANSLPAAGSSSDLKFAISGLPAFASKATVVYKVDGLADASNTGLLGTLATTGENAGYYVTDALSVKNGVIAKGAFTIKANASAKSAVTVTIKSVNVTEVKGKLEFADDLKDVYDEDGATKLSDDVFTVGGTARALPDFTIVGDTAKKVTLTNDTKAKLTLKISGIVGGDKTVVTDVMTIASGGYAVAATKYVGGAAPTVVATGADYVTVTVMSVEVTEVTVKHTVTPDGNVSINGVEVDGTSVNGTTDATDVTGKTSITLAVELGANGSGTWAAGTYGVKIGGNLVDGSFKSIEASPATGENIITVTIPVNDHTDYTVTHATMT